VGGLGSSVALFWRAVSRALVAEIVALAIAAVFA